MNRSAPDVFYRECLIESIRAVEGQERTYRFIVATESPVNVGIGRPEVLRMSGASMKRMRPFCSVLDAHCTSGIRSVLGKAKAEIVGRRMEAEITLDPSPEGDGAKIRLDSGSLRTASIGYRVDMSKAIDLRAGQTNGEGDAIVHGPALVQEAWEPYEITLCPVPADEQAVRIRSISEHAGRGRGSSVMEFSGIVPSPAPAPMSNQPVAASGPPAAEHRDLPEEIVARRRAALDSQIRSLAPACVRDVADECVMRGMDLEGARAAISAAYIARRAAPNGTPEPSTVKPLTPPNGEQNNPAPELTADTVLRALTGLRS